MFSFLTIYFNVFSRFCGILNSILFLFKFILLRLIDFSTIMDLHRRFVALCRRGILKMDVFSFIEMKFTELSVFYLRIIGVDSGGMLFYELFLQVNTLFL